MLALAGAGRQAEALAAYQHARRVLVDELGIEPGSELCRLHERILAGETELPAPPKPPLPIPAPPMPAPSIPAPIPPPIPPPTQSMTESTRLPEVPRQLPAAARHFTGRHTELDTLTGLLEQTGQPAGAGGTVVISAIDGMAGIGKTTLAVHVAHLLADQFPDGQLFIDLHGYTQGYEPRTPGEALDWFLRALEIPPQRIPRDVEERAALYRQQLAATRTLIVLDNAADEAQVRPLLPGGAGCLVLVTSRRRLKGLDDAFALPLDVLPQGDAVRLLRAVAGPGRVPVDDPVATEIVELCGRLPLAVRIAGALLRHRRAWSPEHLAGLLRDQSQRLAALADGERDLGAVFDLSYHGLTDAQRSLYRSLGRNPGPDFDAYAVAALTGTDPATATRLLEELVDHNLVVNHSLSRYRLHDLIRAHARTQSAHDSAADRESAVDRLLDYYQHTAARADALIARRGRSALAGFVPAHAPALPDPETARVWLRTERANLFSALQYAADAACEERIVALTSGLAGLLRTDGPWTQAITLHTASATVAERLGDRSGQANALMESGVVRRLTNDHAGALRDLEAALDLHRDLGDRPGQATTLISLGGVRRLIGDHAGAVRDLEAALDLHRDLGDRSGQATALNVLGGVRRLIGDHAGAVRDLEAALDLHRDLGDRLGQAHTMTFLGGVRRLIGDFPGAVRDLGAALDLHRDLGDGFGQANTLVLLGNMRGLIGDHAGAVRDVEAALDLHRDLGNRLGQANAMATLGIVRSGTGDFPGAMRDLEAALGLYRDLGVRGSEVWALNHYAAVFTATGDHARAFSLYRVSLDLARETRQPDEQAFALGGIGECHLHTGDTENGTAHLTQALEIFQRLGMTPDADRVRARLGSFTSGAAQKA